MSDQRRVKVVAAARLGGQSCLSIDGRDISQYVQGFTVRGRVGEITKLELELISSVRLEMTDVDVKIVERPRRKKR